MNETKYMIYTCLFLLMINMRKVVLIELIIDPVQKFNRDLAEIGEISPRLTRSRRDLGEINGISPRSRLDKRDLAEI